MTTRVLCCYATLHPETERSVKAFAPGSQFVDTSLYDEAYSNVLTDAWSGEEDLVVIEQDILITPDVIPSFTNCPEPWCVYSYQGPPLMGHLYHSLGCTRFSAELQRERPLKNFISGSSKWYLLDGKIERLLDGLVPHVHGHVGHLRAWQEYYEPFAKERQPDKSYRLYHNKPDGTRGEFAFNLSSYNAQLKFVMADGILCAYKNGVITPYVSDEDKRKWPEVHYARQEAAPASSGSLFGPSSGVQGVGGPLRGWRALRRYFRKPTSLRRSAR